jgi:hypothetical protein
MSAYEDVIAKGKGWRLTIDKCNGIAEITFEAGFRARTDHGRSTVTVEIPDDFVEEFIKQSDKIIKEL